MGSKSKMPAARLGDIDTGHPPSPPTPVIIGSTNVLINSRPAARKGDMLAPHHPGIRTISEGSGSVKINGKPAARVSDSINCGGKLIIGAFNVLIGDKPESSRNAKLSVEVEELLIQKSQSSTSKNLTPYQSAQMAASIAVKYRGSDGGVATWHDYYMSNSATNPPKTSAEKKGFQRAEAEKAKIKKEDAALKTQMASAEKNESALNPLSEKMIEAISVLSEGEYATPAMEMLAGQMMTAAGISDKDQSTFKQVVDTAKSFNDKKKTSKSDSQQIDSKRANKKVEPKNFEEAINILQKRREEIAQKGYNPKYSDAELEELAQKGDVGGERFQVRFMATKYLEHRDSKDVPLSGALGLPVKNAKNYKGAKYWATSFDQIEDADSDPKLISEKLGLTYYEDTDYSLIIIDNEKAAPLSGLKSVPATFEKVGEYSSTELPDDFSEEFVDKVMNEEFQAFYNQHYNAAVANEDLIVGNVDVDDFDQYLDSTNLSNKDKKNLKLRMKMHQKIGNNEDYLGNGLTKNNVSSVSNNFGAVETLNFERRETNLKTLSDHDAISIINL